MKLKSETKFFSANGLKVQLFAFRSKQKKSSVAKH